MWVYSHGNGCEESGALQGCQCWTHSGHHVQVLLWAAKVLGQVIHAEVFMLAGINPGPVLLCVWDSVQEDPERFPNRFLANWGHITVPWFFTETSWKRHVLKLTAGYEYAPKSNVIKQQRWLLPLYNQGRQDGNCRMRKSSNWFDEDCCFWSCILCVCCDLALYLQDCLIIPITGRFSCSIGSE